MAGGYLRCWEVDDAGEEGIGGEGCGVFVFDADAVLDEDDGSLALSDGGFDDLGCTELLAWQCFGRYYDEVEGALRSGFFWCADYVWVDFDAFSVAV